ncbi:MAG: M67 family metallopeptidase [Anaerolineae bacterium]|nr:M67 family metallopeptidase [Anaerolineae bacterium]
MLILTPAHRETLARHAEACYPNEACALLVGRSENGIRAVSEVVIVANAWQAGQSPDEAGHSQRDRYLIAPRDIAQTDRAAHQRGLDLIGVFHSHPDHPSRPSATDLAQAWPEMSYLIAAVYAGHTTSLQSWRLCDDAFVEEALQP